LLSRRKGNNVAQAWRIYPGPPQKVNDSHQKEMRIFLFEFVRRTAFLAESKSHPFLFRGDALPLFIGADEMTAVKKAGFQCDIVDVVVRVK